MARILICIIISLSALGCSTGGGVRPTYPAPDLVEITPTDDLKGAYVGFNVGAIREHGFVSVAKANPIKSVVATAATGYLLYLGYDEFIKSESKPEEPEATPASVGVFSGGRGVQIENFSGDFSVTIEDHESGSGNITVIGTQPDR
tara:strand:+ start:717 stop:1154 length:438 start_codon:yes stop_codon:yes gene_type:complete